MAKLLLIEDDNNLREIFEMRLQAEGYETLTASDGEEGLTVAMKEKPDLIIADVMMPKLSGFEMLETLRASPEMGQVKVVMMTALGQAEDRTRGEKLGVIKYLVKSQVTLEDFVRVVREVLNPDQAGAASAAAPATDSAKADALAINKQGSEKTMPDDNTMSTNPAMPDPAADPSAGADGNPISGAPASGDTGSDGQMSTAQEQDNVQGQINDFVTGPPTGDSSAPAMPGAPTPPAGDDSTEHNDVPVMPPPATDTPTEEPKPDDSKPGAMPPSTPGSV